MRFGYYGYDATFRSLFPLVIAEAGRHGHASVWIPPQVKGAAIVLKENVHDCDVVLLGLSSTQTQEELALVDACRRVVVIADVPGSELRPQARPWIYAERALPFEERKLRGLILALGTSRFAASEFGYPPEDIYYVGPPPHWGASYRQMIAIDRVHARIGVVVQYMGQERLLSSDDALVVVPGTKNPFVVNAMLRCAIDAGQKIFGRRFVLGFAPHPGERAEKPEEEADFARAFAERDGILNSGLRRANLSHLANPQRYAIADLVITTGGPTETIAASYARNTRVAYYRDDKVIEYLAAGGIQDGKWFVAELGAACIIEPHNYLRQLAFLMSHEGQEYTLAQQEKHFALPDTWRTAPAIVDLLEKVAGE